MKKEEKTEEYHIDELEQLRKRIAQLEAFEAQRRRAEQQIRELSAAVGQSIDGIAIGDLQPKLTYANDAFASMHGYCPQEMIGTKVESLHNEQQIDEYKRAMHQIKTQGSWRGEIDHIREDGTPFPTYMSVTLLKDEKQRPTGILAVCRDITERVQAEEELKDSEAQKKAILDASVDRIRLVDRDLRIIWANKTALRSLNIASEDLVGKHCYKAFHGRKTPCTECPSRKALKTGRIEHTILYRPKGQEVIKGETYVDSYGVPIKDESGEIVTLIQINRDITETKTLEQALRRREKELELKTASLEEANAALKVLLKRRDEDKIELEEKVLSNVKELIVPYVEKIKKSHMDERQMGLLGIIESNLQDIIAPFSRQLSSKFSSLTPKEIQVAGLVKEGKTTKEMAALLVSTTDAIEFHRKNLRKKLGLKNTKANLRSYLMSLP